MSEGPSSHQIQQHFEPHEIKALREAFEVDEASEIKFLNGEGNLDS